MKMKELQPVIADYSIEINGEKDPRKRHMISKMSSDSKWRACRRAGMVGKKVYSNMEGFIKPIDGQIKMNALLTKINNDLYNKACGIGKKEDKDLTLNISEEYKKQFKYVHEQWKDRLEHSGGTMLMQYNIYFDFEGNAWERALTPGPSEYTGKGSRIDWKKISWFRYFLVEEPLYYAVKLVCGIRNLFNYKKIKKAEAIAKAEADQWFKQAQEAYEYDLAMEEEMKNGR